MGLYEPGRLLEVKLLYLSAKMRDMLGVLTLIARLINELSEAQGQQRLGRLQKQLQSHELIILDEVGFIPFTPSGSEVYPDYQQVVSL